MQSGEVVAALAALLLASAHQEPTPSRAMRYTAAAHAGAWLVCEEGGQADRRTDGAARGRKVITARSRARAASSFGCAQGLGAPSRCAGRPGRQPDPADRGRLAPARRSSSCVSGCEATGCRGTPACSCARATRSRSPRSCGCWSGPRPRSRRARRQAGARRRPRSCTRSWPRPRHGPSAAGCASIDHFGGARRPSRTAGLPADQRRGGLQRASLATSLMPQSPGEVLRRELARAVAGAACHRLRVGEIAAMEVALVALAC